MRIAVVSIMFKQTPPRGYGGIERVVSLLVEELVRQGHEVTLFATPGSYCSGTTVEVSAYDPSKAPSGFVKKSDILSEEPLYTVMNEYLKSHPVDVIHDWSFQNLFVLRHQDTTPFVISTCIPQPPDYSRPNLVACSRAHAGMCGEKAKYVYYGLDLDTYSFNYVKKDYFIHIAKIARYKGQHLAIRAFRKISEKLLIAGNVEDRLYYNGLIRPLLWCSSNVSYIGEIQGTNKYLADAKALIQTPRWFDAFPLVILESFASGTPVIAFPEGGIPEQIVHGHNGFICRTVNDLADAVMQISDITPRTCRQYAEEHFSVERMARDYCALYQRVLDGDRW
jgi:glycosyltransferase involved in cell wall biosynthesis